jgi:hypothetical protein
MTKHKATTVGLLIGAAVAATVAAVDAVPASAVVPAPLPVPALVVTVETDTTGADLTTDPKHATAYCRGGTKLVGTGFTRNSGGSGVVVDQVVPTVGQPGQDDHVTATAYATPAGAPFAWSLTVRAFCASGVSNVEVVDHDSLFDTSVPKRSTANCPFGKKVVGTAFQALGASGEVMVTKVDPVAGTAGGVDHVDVTAYPDDDGITGDWGVKAFAFCATAPSGVQVVARTVTPSTQNTTTVCPRPKVALGAGFVVDDVAQGNVMVYGLTIFEVFTTDHGAIASATEDADGTAAVWGLTAKAICANG